ncbi:hypothetical protein [Treponema endosymbiont of Eucomonympha sp.]|uniref:hypothetical protein n=1 Tax=Treponema endosymbiont of Eucomonympha sp. TaxID=1580831 RepID=UPI000B1EA244|nr:hypothetical protein [Treponema endosymbiont of Eucomonympha sp.]
MAVDEYGILASGTVADCNQASSARRWGIAIRCAKFIVAIHRCFSLTSVFPSTLPNRKNFSFGLNYDFAIPSGIDASTIKTGKPGGQRRALST